LSTYAAWWIKQSIKRAAGEPEQDHPPAGAFGGQDFPMRKATALLQEELGREPTNDELARELGFRSTKSRI